MEVDYLKGQLEVRDINIENNILNTEIGEMTFAIYKFEISKK